MKRIRPTKAQYDRLLESNAHRCCVCKRRSIGFHLHHIDGNNTNTVDKNLAVLCVEDHDRHHRPNNYTSKPKHTELGAAELIQFKNNWESFIAEARCPEPRVIATLAVFGTSELVHSLQLVMQWPDERIAMTQSYHLLDGTPDKLTDDIIADVKSIGKNLKLIAISEPLPVEHCPCCSIGYSLTIKHCVVTRLVDPNWSTRSLIVIYINPIKPCIHFIISLSDEILLSGKLHLCGGTHLSYYSEYFEERISIDPARSVRTQATDIIKDLIKEWHPAVTIYGTGDHNKPTRISNLLLPKIWEIENKIKRQSKRRKQ